MCFSVAAASKEGSLRTLPSAATLFPTTSRGNDLSAKLLSSCVTAAKDTESKSHLRSAGTRCPHLLLQLLPGLQALVSPQQSQFFQLLPLHSSGQEEVEGKRHVLGVPAARHVHVVLRLDPERIDL